MKRLVLLLALAAPACSGSTPTPITPTVVVPACQQNNTGTVTFEDRFPSTTLDVVWDGAKIATIAAGQRSTAFTFAANVAHTLTFQVTNTTIVACGPGNPVLTQCASQNYFCPAG